jgi:hypothetical protein
MNLFLFSFNFTNRQYQSERLLISILGIFLLSQQIFAGIGPRTFASDLPQVGTRQNNKSGVQVNLLKSKPLSRQDIPQKKIMSETTNTIVWDKTKSFRQVSLIENGTAIEAADQKNSEIRTYTIPFGTRYNSIELTVQNASTSEPAGVTVTPQKTPSWLHITPEKIVTKSIKPGGSDSITFTFSIDNTAPVKQTQEIKFVVSSKSGESWTKKMNLTVDAPASYKLYQNYPNPFNPATTISYQLPEDGKVSLIIYNILGQQVATLVDEVQNAGYKQVVFNVNKISSGVYFYRLRAGSFTEIKKMLFIR